MADLTITLGNTSRTISYNTTGSGGGLSISAAGIGDYYRLTTDGSNTVSSVGPLTTTSGTIPAWTSNLPAASGSTSTSVVYTVQGSDDGVTWANTNQTFTLTRNAIPAPSDISFTDPNTFGTSVTITMAGVGGSGTYEYSQTGVAGTFSSSNTTFSATRGVQFTWYARSTFSGQASSSISRNYTPVLDTTPDGYSTHVYTDQTDVGRNTTRTSATAYVVSGLNAPATISVSGTGGSNHQYGINGVYSSTNGSVQNGQSITARHTSSGNWSITATTTVTIGGVGASFSSTTNAQDTTPDAFSFSAVTGATVSTVYSTFAQINGITGDVTVSRAGVSGTAGEFSISATTTPGTWGTTGTITNGQYLHVRITSSAQSGATSITNYTVGTATQAFSVSTVALDTTLTLNTTPTIVGGVISLPYNHSTGVSAVLGGCASHDYYRFRCIESSLFDTASQTGNTSLTFGLTEPGPDGGTVSYQAQASSNNSTWVNASPAQFSITKAVVPAPSTVSAVTGSQQSATASITVSATGGSGTYEYNVTASATTPTTGWAASGTFSATTDTSAALNRGAQYYIWARSTYVFGSTYRSSPISNTHTLGYLSADLSLTGSSITTSVTYNDTNNITYTWTGNTAPTSYKIQKETSPSVWTDVTTASLNASSAILTFANTPTPGNSSNYRVAGGVETTNGGNGSYSATNLSWTLSRAVVPPPTDIGYTDPGTKDANVTVTLVATGGTGTYEYSSDGINVGTDQLVAIRGNSYGRYARSVYSTYRSTWFPDTVTVLVLPPPSSIISGARTPAPPLTYNSTSDVTFTVTVPETGSGVYYQLRKDGTGNPNNGTNVNFLDGVTNALTKVITLSYAAGELPTQGQTSTYQWLAERYIGKGGDGNLYNITSGTDFSFTISRDDGTPDAFSFTAVTGATPSTAYTTYAQINGISGSIPVSKSGTGEFAITSSTATPATWPSTGSITNGQYLHVRVTSSTNYNTAVSTSYTVGASAATPFSVTTIVPPTVGPQTYLTTVARYISHNISASGGVGGTLEYAISTSATYNTSLIYGWSTSNAFTATASHLERGQTYYFWARRADAAGAAASFAEVVPFLATDNNINPIPDETIGAGVTSWNISIVGGSQFNTYEIRDTDINGTLRGGRNDSGTLTVTDTTFSNVGGATKTYAVTAYRSLDNGGSGLANRVLVEPDSTYVVTREDAQPNAFSFDPQYNIALGATITSNAITVSGLGTGVFADISVSGVASSQYSINSTVTFTNGPGQVQNGDLVRARHTNSIATSTATTTTVTIGDTGQTLSANFVTTTRPDRDITITTTPAAVSNTVTLAYDYATTVAAELSNCGLNDWYRFVDITSGPGTPGTSVQSTTGDTTPNFTLAIPVPNSSLVYATEASSDNSNWIATTASNITIQRQAVPVPATVSALTGSGATPSVTVTATGGTGDYQYSLNGSTWQTSAVFTNQTRGTALTIYVRSRYFQELNLYTSDPTQISYTVVTLPVVDPVQNLSSVEEDSTINHTIAMTSTGGGGSGIAYAISTSTTYNSGIFRTWQGSSAFNGASGVVRGSTYYFWARREDNAAAAAYAGPFYIPYLSSTFSVTVSPSSTALITADDTTDRSIELKAVEKNTTGAFYRFRRTDGITPVSIDFHNPAVDPTLPKVITISYAGGNLPPPGSTWTYYYESQRYISAGGDGSYSPATGTNASFTLTRSAADTTPSPFNFPDAGRVTKNTIIYFSELQITGFDTATSISVSGSGSPEYKISTSAGTSPDAGTWTSTAGTLSPSRYVRVRHRSANADNTLVTSTINIGGVTDNFSSQTYRMPIYNLGNITLDAVTTTSKTLGSNDASDVTVGWTSPDSFAQYRIRRLDFDPINNPTPTTTVSQNLTVGASSTLLDFVGGPYGNTPLPSDGYTGSYRIQIRVPTGQGGDEVWYMARRPDNSLASFTISRIAAPVVLDGQPFDRYTNSSTITHAIALATAGAHGTLQYAVSTSSTYNASLVYSWTTNNAFVLTRGNSYYLWARRADNIFDSDRSNALEVVPPVSVDYGIAVYNSSGTRIFDTSSRIARSMISSGTVVVSANSWSSAISGISLDNENVAHVVVTAPALANPADYPTTAGLFEVEVNYAPTNTFRIRNNAAVSLTYSYYVFRTG